LPSLTQGPQRAVRTLEDIERTLPNGFRGALLVSLRVDYEARTLGMRMEISAGRVGGADREAYRMAVIVLRDLEFLAIDASGAPSPVDGKLLRVDAGPGHPSHCPHPAPSVSGEAFLHWFSVGRWNSFIRVAARQAEIHWAKDDLAPGAE
jgi:hypothetical protein